jgi:hypothetical protein
MGLTMKERRKITAETAGRYQKASKKEKSLTLNWFTELTGYNRSYTSHLLSLQGRKINLKPKLRLKADLRAKVKRKREKIYDERVKEALLLVWKILNYPSSIEVKGCLKGGDSQANPVWGDSSGKGYRGETCKDQRFHHRPHVPGGEEEVPA